MKAYKLFIYSLIIFTLCACGKAEDPISPSFIGELRPQYFEQLNFNSEEVVAELPRYLNDFATTYNRLEEEYKDSIFVSQSDLENMGLANMYYSSLLTGVVKGYLDSLLIFKNIIGTRKEGLFSELPPSDSNFEKKEMEAMANRAVEVATLGISINGFNDRRYGAFLAAQLIFERLKHSSRANSPILQKEMVEYAQNPMMDYDFFPSWNLLMSLVYFDNYADNLNTFRNGDMEIILNNVINRLDPAVLPNLTINYNSILAPMYQFDLVMKKVDWLIHKNDALTSQEVQAIGAYITRLETVERSIATDREELLNTWDFKSTFEERQQKLIDLKVYFSGLTSGQRPFKPELAPFFLSRGFKQAYQCYACHKSPNL